MTRKFDTLVLCLLFTAFAAIPSFAGEAKTESNPDRRTNLSFDLGYLTPLGLETGVGVMFPFGFLPYTQFGFGLSGMIPDGQEKWGKGLFATWALGFRLRVPKLHFKSQFTNYFTFGYLVRDFYAINGGNALDSLYSTDWSDQLDIPFNYYITLGYRFGPAYLSLEFRISDFKGHYTVSGYDPYGVAGSWYNEINDVNPPRVILILAARFDWPIPSGGAKSKATESARGEEVGQAIAAGQTEEKWLPPAVNPAQEEEKIVWVMVRSANIRDGPSTQSKVIAGAKWNDKLSVIEEREQWYQVKLPNGQDGWVHRSLCSSKPLYSGTPLEKNIEYIRTTKFVYRGISATYAELSTTYAFAYENPQFIGWEAAPDPDNPVATLVTMKFSISGVPADILNAPENEVSYSTKTKMKEAVPLLRITWRVNDLISLKITPYNFYAQDALTVYKDIVGGLHKLGE